MTFNPRRLLRLRASVCQVGVTLVMSLAALLAHRLAQAENSLPPLLSVDPILPGPSVTLPAPSPWGAGVNPLGLPAATPVPAPAAPSAPASAPAVDPLPLAQSYETLDADLWARIRRGFGMPDLQDSYVTRQEQWYATRAPYIARMTERSSKYLFHIVEELERRNMPTELALLPFIESAFNPKAESTAKAAGMWQFIPSTGRDFSLKQNMLRDDRRDVLASTRAALDYLQKLYGLFGDWHLALAAYNWGEGSVGRALAKNQREGLPQDYSSLKMPDETRNYVPKLQAVKNIISNPASFNLQLPDIPNHPYFKSVPIAKDLDVALAAKLAEMDIEAFKALNPSANKPTIFAAATPYILLPWDNVGIYERNLSIHNGQTAGWTVWTAPSAIKVADAAKKFGLSEARFREINSIPPRMSIKAGSTLLVPRGAHHHADVSEQVADNAQLNLAAEVALVKRTVTLTKSESVAAFAKRTGHTPANVAAWNNVALNASFKPKQQVVIWVPKQAKTGKRPAPAKPSSTQKAPANAGQKSVAKAAKATKTPTVKAQ